MTSEEFGRFEHESAEYLTAQQDALRTKYDLESYERWDYYQETGEFVFSDSGIRKLIAQFQVVGSISTVTNTWLWSWANPTILENVRDKIQLVKDFGEEHKLKELTQEKWEAKEIDGWAMTNVSARLLNAKGAYRCPDDNGFLFVVFTDIQWASA